MKQRKTFFLLQYSDYFQSLFLLVDFISLKDNLLRKKNPSDSITLIQN